MNPERIQHAAELVEQADLLVITAGAGMGVDSGLPDFRGNEGFWRAYPALARAGIEFQSMANPAWFRRDPALAWGFYGHRLALYRATQPHEGFALLRRWAAATELGAVVFTSNVDGQFQRAGFPEDLIWECHGSLMHLQCSRPCGEHIWPAERFAPEVDEASCRLLNEPPRCPHCDALARPNVLMFGDGDWVDTRESAQAEAVTPLLESARKPLVIELGAGTAVPSVRRFGHRMLQQHDARLLRINVREPEVPGSYDLGLAMGALAALRAIDERL
ncbi:Sir2 family NAD-dependent protein deacetylase [Paucibacter sp. APW11]|uniref:protein acetyllysine N-acetyltransferase n=1 Tax=Roseateles aquae TaxID=3077235 RepID=A0ABU3PFC1_9BURK|nr:Sir2 family NAD-dependent protein deacetylase [Paucibacter sp. APW11]MDT9000616.1 Sir2 family NAD-dependent protein deacetylase [Paucibacter sp. APW11]